MDGFSISNNFSMRNTGAVKGVSEFAKESLESVKGSNGESKVSFAETLNEAIDQVNQLQKTSDKSIQALATGKTDNVAEVMIAAEKSEIALRTMVQVRNKIVEAYQDIMKMQV